jgi:Uma2 family endonuclease
MTSLPQPPDRLLSITDYAELGENERGRYELQEGRLVMSPSPTPDHMIALARLFAQLERQLPPQLGVVPDVDLDLQLAPLGQPGWSRRPDLVIVGRKALERVRLEGGLLRAEETEVVVEVVSPGSRRTDYVIKRGEYADAGIHRYWIVDLERPISLIECVRSDEFGYVNASEVTGMFSTGVPCPLTVRLDELQHS